MSPRTVLHTVKSLHFKAFWGYLFKQKTPKSLKTAAAPSAPWAEFHVHTSNPCMEHFSHAQFPLVQEIPDRFLSMDVTHMEFLCHDFCVDKQFQPWSPDFKRQNDKGSVRGKIPLDEWIKGNWIPIWNGDKRKEAHHPLVLLKGGSVSPLARLGSTVSPKTRE